MRSLVLKSALLICFFGFLLVFFQNCTPAGEKNPNNALVVTPTPKGNRILSLDLNDMTGTGNFNDNLNLAAQVGIQAVPLSFDWNQIEPAGNENTSGNPSFAYTDPGSNLAIANSVYGTHKIKVALSIRPIYINQLVVPVGLRNTPFVSTPSSMSDRYFLMLKWVLTQKLSGVKLTSLSIGTEIDACVGKVSGCIDPVGGSHSVSWLQYSQFLLLVKAYIAGDSSIQSLHSGLKVGMTSQYSALISDLASSTKPIQSLNTNGSVDAVHVTYYPLNSNFTVSNPLRIKEEFKALLDGYPPTIPIVVMEAGLPSGAVNSSSESYQADFVKEIFEMWDSNAERIPYLCFTRLNDKAGGSSTSECQGNVTCEEFIRTLGLRTYLAGQIGNDKFSFARLVAEAKLRGWK